MVRSGIYMRRRTRKLLIYIPVSIVIVLAAMAAVFFATREYMYDRVEQDRRKLEQEMEANIRTVYISKTDIRQGELLNTANVEKLEVYASMQQELYVTDFEKDKYATCDIPTGSYLQNCIDENFGSRKLIKVGSKADLERAKYYTTGNNRFDMSQAEMKLTALLDGMTYAELCSQRKSLFYYGGIRIPHSLRTYISNKYIDYINQDIKQNLKQDISETLTKTILEEGNKIMRRQRWHGEYYLPENCIIMKKGGNVMKNSDILKDGYLIVNFDIVADNTESRYTLDYVNEKNHTEQGHCSMWENDLIDEMVRLENGNSFRLYPGDLFVYDTSRLLQEEYTREVTH